MDQRIASLKAEYDRLRQGRNFPLVTLQAQGVTQDQIREAVRARPWEKTVEKLYYSWTKASYIAPLAHAQENYGDAIAAFARFQWCLIEFKKTSTDISSERKKYFCLNKEKYEGQSKDEQELNDESAMYATLMNLYAKAPAKAQDGAMIPREPHFIIYGEIDDAAKMKLHGQLYWRDWSVHANSSAGKGSPIELPEIPAACASYDEFIVYAACIRLAKSGKYTMKESHADDQSGSGGASLEDLSCVLGLSKDQGKTELAVMITLDQFMQMHEPAMTNALTNTNAPTILDTASDTTTPSQSGPKL